jgi:hypothetical protein
MTRGNISMGIWYETSCNVKYIPMLFRFEVLKFSLGYQQDIFINFEKWINTQKNKNIHVKTNIYSCSFVFI